VKRKETTVRDKTDKAQTDTATERVSERFPGEALRNGFVKIYYDLWQRVNKTYFRVSSDGGKGVFSEYRDIGRVLEHSLQRAAHSLCICTPGMPDGANSPAVELAVRVGNMMIHEDRSPEAFREELAKLQDDPQLQQYFGEYMAHLGFNVILYCSHLAHVRGEIAPYAQAAVDHILEDAEFSAVTADPRAGEKRPEWLDWALMKLVGAVTAVLPADLIRRVVLRRRLKTFDPYQVNGRWMHQVYMPFFLNVSEELDRLLVEDEEERKRIEGED